MNADIKALDRALRRGGEDVTLRRVATPTNKDVTVRARVRSPKIEEIASGVKQTDSFVIMSPSEIAAAGWPGGEAPSLTVPDPTLPRINDKLVIAGRVRNVEQVNPVRIQGALVRLELRVAG